MQKLIFLIFSAMLFSFPLFAQEQTTRERVLHHRAMEAAIWAMPAMNFKFYRDALIGAGVGSNDVGYF